jgi:hypothetical protein
MVALRDARPGELAPTRALPKFGYLTDSVNDLLVSDRLREPPDPHASHDSEPSPQTSTSS